MFESTTVLTPYHALLPLPTSGAFCSSNFSTLIWWNVTSASVCSPVNNCHNIFTFLEKAIIINYKCVALKDMLRCSLVVIKQINSLYFLCVVMEYEQAALFFSYGRRLCFLMKCRPFRMRTQWGVGWGLSIPPLPLFLFFVSSSLSSLGIWTSCTPHLLED